MSENPEITRILKVSASALLALGSLTLGNRVVAERDLPAENRPRSAGHTLAIQCAGPMLAAKGCFTVITEAIPTSTEPEPTTSVPTTQAPVTTTTERVATTEPETTVPAPQAKPTTTLAPQASEETGAANSLGVFEATCYSLEGTTASGRPVGPGVVAVDPRVIPLGTQLMVEGYGAAVAADTGGAIKGNIIDVWMPTDSDCYAWGRQVVRVSAIG